MMGTDNPTGKIVKIRWAKEYEAAKNHVCVGEVKGHNPNCLVVYGRTFHFGSTHAGSIRGVRTGQIKTRWIPWVRIAVITELPADLDWKSASFKLNREGRLVLDDRMETLIEEL